MNKKLLIIPATLLASSLLLTGCTGGGDNKPTTSPTSSSPSTPGPDTPVTDGELDLPKDMSLYYAQFTHPFETTVEDNWAYYKEIGAKTSLEDPSARLTNQDDWDKARGDSASTKFDLYYGEISSDVEQSALKISEYLKANPEATLDDIKAQNFVVNRYGKLVKLYVDQDKDTKFFYVIGVRADGEDGIVFGIIVPQEGITPEGVIPSENPTN